MFERFTDRARKIMALANQEAQRFNHEYVGTEHMLLGLVKEGSGVAANVLKNLEVDLRKVRLEVEKLVKSGPDMVTLGRLPQTPRTKKVIEYAIDEARALHHNYIGTEHLLLGLIREQDGVAAQVLLNLGVTLEEVRATVLELLGANCEDRKTVRKTVDVEAAKAVFQTGVCVAATKPVGLADQFANAERGLKELIHGLTDLGDFDKAQLVIDLCKRLRELGG